MPSRLSPCAMARGLRPARNSEKMRRTTAACSSSISRSPRSGSPSLPSFTTRR